jgi:phospholipid transport system substrate-binding protein
LVLLLPAAALRAQHEQTVQVVEGLHAALLDAMQRADELGFTGRRDKLAPVIEAAFDFDTIARIVLGAHYRELSAEQRETFKQTFVRLSVATYASNFSGFSGEKFETASVEEQSNSVMVNTHLVKGSGEKVSLNYIMRERPEGARIVNVLAEGVSDVALKRADYSAVISSQGFEGLLDKLNNRIEALAKGG